MLSDRYGMHINNFLKEFSSMDIAELMAYDQLNDEDYKKGLIESMKTKEEIKEENNIALKAIFGFKG